MNTHRSKLGLMLIAAIILSPACAKKAPPAPEPVAAAAPAPRPAPTPEPPAPAAGEWEAAEPAEATLTPEEINRMGVLRRIFFDYDEAEIRPDQRPTLQSNAAWLREHPGVKILVEGHADERGTREYNLALGDRRASAAKDYLSSLGIATSRIEIISYGEERPVVSGESEQSWSQNRRGDFVVVAVETT